MILDAKRARVWALGATALGLLLRFGYTWHAYHAHYLPTSSDGYETLAISMLEKGQYADVPGHSTAQREPAYPLFIAAVYGLFGQRPGIVLFLQCWMSAATGWLLWLIGRRLFGEAVALAALGAFMASPQSVYYSAFFFRETWLCFWFGVLTWASLSWSAEDRRVGDRGALIGGLSATLFGMANSAVLPASGLAGVLLWLVAPKASRPRRAALYFIPLFLGFGAWTARNWSLFGRFVAGSTHGGQEFYQALVVPPEDLGTERQGQILSAIPLFMTAESLPEFERNEMLMKASFRWIAEHPGLYASRVAAGVCKFWKIWPYKRAYHHSYLVLFLASLLFEGWVIPLGFYGLWRFRSLWRKAPAFPAAFFAMTLVYGAIHAVIRYRLPLMGGMVLLACAAAAELAQRWAPASRGRSS